MTDQVHKELSTLVSSCVLGRTRGFGCFHLKGIGQFPILLLYSKYNVNFSFLALAASLSLTPLCKQPSMEIRYT